MNKCSSTVICEGLDWLQKKQWILSEHGIDVNSEQSKMLNEVAKTALTGKSAGAVREFLADICVRAVICVGGEEDGESMSILMILKYKRNRVVQLEILH